MAFPPKHSFLKCYVSCLRQCTRRCHVILAQKTIGPFLTLGYGGIFLLFFVVFAKDVWYVFFVVVIQCFEQHRQNHRYHDHLKATIVVLKLDSYTDITSIKVWKRQSCRLCYTTHFRDDIVMVLITTSLSNKFQFEDSIGYSIYLSSLCYIRNHDSTNNVSSIATNSLETKLNGATSQ